jgi:hypothetical protein
MIGRNSNANLMVGNVSSLIGFYSILKDDANADPTGGEECFVDIP